MLVCYRGEHYAAITRVTRICHNRTLRLACYLCEAILYLCYMYSYLSKLLLWGWALSPLMCSFDKFKYKEQMDGRKDFIS